MRLEKARITNFRCIDDSTEFKVSDVTCLVGKNESGKTTVLQGLERLNPYDTTHAEYDRIRDYPRKHLADYAARHGDKPAIVARSTWSLNQAEIAKIENILGKECLKSHEITIEKGYSKGTTFDIPLNSTKALDHLLTQAGCTAEGKQALAQFTSSKALHDHIAKLGAEASDGMKTLMAKIAAFRDHNIQCAAIDQLRMPKFMYFSNYDRMSGDVSIEKLRTDIANNTVSEGDRVFLDFLKFAGTELEELATIKQYEHLRARVEAASIKITNQIFEYWSQNQHLKVQFTIDAARDGDPPPFNTGTVMRARVYNALHDMTVPFSDRSAGFIWFFSFLVSFSQVKKEQGNAIILLDEPGLNLHGRAQGDLLRYIEEKLKPDHQVIYTTHSPFMVPADRLDWVRTVEDVVEQKGAFKFISHGTKVGSDILSTDRDTLFPLQAALGYEITQSLFVGEHTLLVEGPSDILYLKAASNELAARGRPQLDRRWTVCPANGLDKVAAFLSLFGGNKLHVAVLLDYAKGQKAKVDQLKQSKLLQDGHVFTVVDFVSQDEGDIEDLLGPKLYVQIVNSSFALQPAQQLDVGNIIALAPETSRLVRKIDAAFKVLQADAPEFDHYTPASWLIENPKTLKNKSTEVTEALDRFEKIFARLNGLLPLS
jgi:energy-coupling factor transporter ATP-binding protein EcfA2